MEVDTHTTTKTQQALRNIVAQLQKHMSSRSDKVDSEHHDEAVQHAVQHAMQLVIPDDVINLIWGYLDMRTYIHFRSTCKRWRLRKLGCKSVTEMCMKESYVDLVKYRGTFECIKLIESAKLATSTLSATSSLISTLLPEWLKTCIKSNNVRFCDALIWVMFYKVDISKYDTKALFIMMITTDIIGNICSSPWLMSHRVNLDYCLLKGAIESNDHKTVQKYARYYDKRSTPNIRFETNILWHFVRFDDVELLQTWYDMLNYDMKVIRSEHFTDIWTAIIAHDAIKIAHYIGKKNHAFSLLRDGSAVKSEWDAIPYYLDYNDCRNHSSAEDVRSMLNEGGDPHMMFAIYMKHDRISAYKFDEGAMLTEFVQMKTWTLTVSEVLHILEHCNWHGLSPPRWLQTLVKDVMLKHADSANMTEAYRLSRYNSLDWELMWLSVHQTRMSTTKPRIADEQLHARFKELCIKAITRGGIMVSKRILKQMKLVLTVDKMRELFDGIVNDINSNHTTAAVMLQKTNIKNGESLLGKLRDLREYLNL